MTPEQIVALGGLVSGVVGLMAAGLKALWNAYQKQIAARMDDKDVQIADLKVQRDTATAALREGNAGLELNADATDRLGKTVEKLVRGAKVKDA